MLMEPTAEWYEDVEQWLDDALARVEEKRVGGIQLRHQKAWSTVAVVPIAGGILYFKESPRLLRFESAYTHAIAQIRPDAVAVVVAHDAPRGWLLTRDAGVAIGDGYLTRPEDWHE